MNFKSLVYIFSITAFFTTAAMDRKTLFAQELGQLNKHLDTVFTMPVPETTCSICLDTQNENTEHKPWTNVYPCNHSFHIECIGKFGVEAEEKTSQTCPNCRAPYHLPETTRPFFDADTQNSLIERSILIPTSYKKARQHIKRILQNTRTNIMKTEITSITLAILSALPIYLYHLIKLELSSRNTRIITIEDLGKTLYELNIERKNKFLLSAGKQTLPSLGTSYRYLQSLLMAIYVGRLITTSYQWFTNKMPTDSYIRNELAPTIGLIGYVQYLKPCMTQQLAKAALKAYKYYRPRV